ncbi:MAG: cytidine deaminase [Nanoarchaeota archaeon]
MIKEGELKLLAKAASKRAYCPYSNYKVGAALITSSGRIFTGCNVENASYGLTNCAERTAIFKAVSQGEREISGIVTYVSGKGPIAGPCGACRQVIYEFGENAECLDFNEDTEVRSLVSELLPRGFGPRDLGIKIERKR